jgi:protein TonB
MSALSVVPAFNPWRDNSRYRFGCSGLISAAIHGALGVLVMGIVVRAPGNAPPIRVSLYDPPPPPAPLASGVEVRPAAAVQPEPQPVAHQEKLPVAAPHIQRRPTRAETRPSQPERDTPPPAETSGGSVGGVVGGMPGGLTGGTVGGTGVTLLSADQAAYRPEPIAKVMPEYPPIARLRGIEGQVVLQAILAVDGRIEPDISVVQSVPLLDAATIAALRQWRFRPARDAAGAPLRVSLRVPFRFVLR